MGIDFSKYLGLPTGAIDPTTAPAQNGRLRLYTNPIGQTFYVDKTIYRQLKRAKLEATEGLHPDRVDYYLNQTNLPDLATPQQTGRPFKLLRGDQQNSLFVTEAYTYPQGLRVKRTNGNAATQEWQDAGFRLSWVLGAETQRDSAQLARTLFPNIPEVQGGDYSENALPDEVTTMAFIESGLSYRDFCDRFALDPANMPDYHSTMQMLEIFMTENQIAIANQAGANHNVGIAGNAGNSTLTVKNANDRLIAAEARYLAALETNPATSGPSRLAYFNPNAGLTLSPTSSSDLLPLDPRDLPQDVSGTITANPELDKSYRAYARAAHEERASQTFAALQDSQPTRHRGFFGIVPEWFKQKILGAAFNVPKTERPAEVYFPHVDYFNSDDYFSGSITRQLLNLHYREYPDSRAFEDWVTTDMTWNGSDQTLTATRRSFEYNKKPSVPSLPQQTLQIPDLLEPTEALKNFSFFWQQTRTRDGRAEWVCRINFTDRPGLDPAETSFVLVLQDMGEIDGVRRFSRFWPLDATDFRPPSYYYDSTSDLALALMDLARLALPHLYPDDIVLIDDEKHWGVNETFKPTEYPGTPIPVSQVISNEHVSPVQLAWHYHAGRLLDIHQGEEWSGGRRIPILGSQIVMANSPYENQVSVQARSVVDYEGVFYVVTADYDESTGLMTERYTEIDPYAYYLLNNPHSTETITAIDAAMARMAPYLSMDFYSAGTTLPVKKPKARFQLLMGGNLREKMDYTVIAQDSIPTQARVVEMGLAYLEVFIEHLENDVARNPGNSDLQFYLKAYRATYWQMQEHFETWQSKYQAVVARTKDLPPAERDKEIAFACDDLYRNEAFLHRLLMSVDLADDEMRAAAPTTYAVAMELKRALVTADMMPINDNLDETLRESPWHYANTFTARYYVKQSERVKQVAFTPWGFPSESATALARDSH